MTDLQEIGSGATMVGREPALSGIRRVSIVIPFLNERDTLAELGDRIAIVMEELGLSYETLFVDDGSTDGGDRVVRALIADNPHVRLVRLTRNFGKAAAISAGIAHSHGDVIITMDADLQDDPAEIPRFLQAIEAGHDVVSGWKKTRHDPLGKTLPSKTFNALTSRMFDIDIHDINCGFKAYTRRAARQLKLYGELHRFTPALLHAAGYRGTEIAVKHHPRMKGQSKYGPTRMVKGLLDIATVKLVTRYSARPLHFFAMIGLPMFLLGSAILTYLTALWFAGDGPIGTRPLLQVGILFIVTGTQILGIGLVAELLQTVNLREKDKYVIDRIEGGLDVDLMGEI